MDMKNNKLIIILALIFFISTSCEKAEHEINTTDLGTEFFISGSYTSLDSEATLEIENQQKNLSVLNVTALGGIEADGETEFDPPVADLGEITISGGAGSITISDTDLGMTEIGASASFQFDGSNNGKSITRFYDLHVDDPISVEDPGVTHRSDTVYTFEWAIEPVSATVETVTVQTKTSSLDDYVDLPGPFEALDHIEIVGTDYAVGDTLFVNVIGTVGSKTASLESEVMIGPISLSNVESFKLDSEPGKAWDFVDMVYVDAGTSGASADIEFTGSYTDEGLIVGFVANQNAEFVMGTSADYDAADTLTVVNVDYSNAMTMNDNVSGGEIYFYRTKRGNDYYYGIMKIMAVDKPQGVLEDSVIEFEYKF